MRYTPNKIAIISLLVSLVLTWVMAATANSGRTLSHWNPFDVHFTVGISLIYIGTTIRLLYHDGS